MQVEIDVDRCQGHARCNALCPEVFGLDEEGFAFVIQGSDLASRRAKIDAAEANCPERAILVRA